MPTARPTSITCANCGAPVTVNPLGRLPRHCSASCRVAFSLRRKHQRPSARDEQRRVIWDVLIDAGIVARDQPLPPMRKAEDTP
jgi:hypothetical protein